LKDNQKELDESFFNGLTAILFKRVCNYKRNKKAIFNEVILPAIIMVGGFALSLYTPTFRSKSALQTLDRMPMPQ
jgi:hypothetical protein